VKELRCGPIEVHVGHDPGTYELDMRVLHAVSRWRRIKRAIEACGPETAEILRLRFREPLRVERFAFDLGGKALLKRLDDRAPGALRAEFESLRGAGTLAHLTPAARAAHRWSRSTRKIDRWLDVVGRELAASRPRARTLEMAESVRREAENMVTRACEKYAAGWQEARRDQRRTA
jgi:hypothetical protein